ncbi:MAG: AI-2E family transporter [Ruminococcaceae bacterium]|nr:AI-2E family transporter [Oscillospiraceae bacterium]
MQEGETTLNKTPKTRYLYSMLAGFGAISMSIVFFFVLYRFQGLGNAVDKIVEILNPFIYGAVIAYLLRPVCNWYEQKLEKYLPLKLRKLANPAAVALSLITGLLVVYTLIIMIAPELYKSISNIWTTLPDRVSGFIAWATAHFGENEQLLTIINNAYDALYSTIDSWARNTLMPYVSSIVSGVGHSVIRVLQFLLDLLIGLIVAVYLLGSRKKFSRQAVMVIRSTLKPKWARVILDEIAFVDKMFGGFIDGKLVDSAIIGVLCYIGCLIFKFPNALLVSAIVGITNVIPFFGPFIGAVPATLLIMLEDPVKGLWFIAFVFALQQLDGNIIGPKILGDRTGLSSFWVLFGIILFGGLWGLVGMVIAVPLVAVIYDLIKKMVYRGLRKNDCMEVWDAYTSVYGVEKPFPRPAGPEKKNPEDTH